MRKQAAGTPAKSPIIPRRAAWRTATKITACLKTSRPSLSEITDLISATARRFADEIVEQENERKTIYRRVKKDALRSARKILAFDKSLPNLRREIAMRVEAIVGWIEYECYISKAMAWA